MSVDAKYKTTATASGGGRDGKTALADGTISFDLVVPKELGGPGGDGANPEKLFALGYSACFLSAMRRASFETKVKRPDGSTVTATIGIGPRSEGGFGITAELDVYLPNLPEADARKLVEATHEICPYSNAIKARSTSRSRHARDLTIRCRCPGCAAMFGIAVRRAVPGSTSEGFFLSERARQVSSILERLSGRREAFCDAAHEPHRA